MYLTFEPKGAYQGLPPYRQDVMRDWLSGLVGEQRNSNFVLLSGQRVIGHAALVYYPNTPTEQEIVIFVHQDFQHHGLGRQLFLAAMNWACQQLHLTDVWLSVSWDNVKAWRMYSSIGFQSIATDFMDPEVDMVRHMNCAKCCKRGCPIYTAELAGRGRELR